MMPPRALCAAPDQTVAARRAAARANGRLPKDALALQAAGVFTVMLKSRPAGPGARVSAALHVPTVGIGAGSLCDVQIMVRQKLSELTTGQVPKLINRYNDLDTAVNVTVSCYVEEAAENRHLDNEHSYA